MCSIYLPLQLVHAHLPAPPLPPNAIPELRVSTERSFPSSSSSYSDPLHSEHALSVAYDPATGILARAIHNGYVLELRTLSTTVRADLGDRRGSPVVRIYLPDRLLPLVPGCIVYSPRDGKLVVLVVTEEHIVYRFTFPLRHFEEGKGDRISFVTDGDEWCEEYAVDSEVIAAAGGIGAWTVLDENTLVLGGADGGIIRLSRTQSYRSAEWEAAHHRPSAKFRLFGRGTSEDQVVAFASFSSNKTGTLLYALSRDRKLRTWNASTGVCVKTLDVRSTGTSQDLVLRTETGSPMSSKSSSALPNASDTPYLKVLPHPYTTSRYSHLVIAFSPAFGGSSSSAGSFIVYRGTGGTNSQSDLAIAGERPCSGTSAGCALRDFQSVPPFVKSVDGISLNTGWRLIVTWDKSGSAMVETVGMDDIFQFDTYVQANQPSPLLQDWQVASDDREVDQFDPAYFDDLLPLDLPEDSDPFNHDDISSTFIAHFFRPGRFSTLTLLTALDEYLRQLPDVIRMRHVADSRLTLSKRYASVVGQHLTMETDPQSGAPVVSAFRRDLKLHWLGIWARVRSLDKQARWPISMTVIGGQHAILSREAFSVASLPDTPGILELFSSEAAEPHLLRALPEGALRALYPSLAPPKARSSALAIASAGAFISNALSTQNAAENDGSGLDELSTSLDTVVSNAPTQPVENLAGELWDECVEPYLSEESVTTVRRVLSECLDTKRGLTTTLAILNSFDLPFLGNDTSLGLSGAGNALLASAITALASARFNLARQVLLVALFCLSESPDPSSGDEEAEELIDILARSFYLYQRYRALKWLCEQTAEESSERLKARRTTKRKAGDGDDILTEGLGSLKMRELEDQSDIDGFSSTYSLLHSLLDRRYHPAASDNVPDLLLDRSLHFVQDLGLVRPNAWAMKASNADAALGMAILLDGHPTLAGHFAALYPHSASMAYIKGRAYASLGFVNDAVRSLEQAVAGCKDGSLGQLVPAVSGDGAVSEYYRHVANIFAELGNDTPVVHFGQLAIRTAPSSKPAGKDIWTKVFLSNIVTGLYEDAYAVLTATPYPDLKDEFLGQLISVMCENNEIARLNQLGFIGFQDRVEILLSFKARNSDPLRFPNYYKVLCSWHIARGDFRSAGDIMYRQARRFADGASSKISPHELAAMQAQSYLATINALSLVDKRNAWVAIPSASAPRSLRGIKRRRVSANVPDDAYARDKLAIDIVSVDEIRMEYTLVLSQLQLATAAPDLQLQGATMTPEEVIGILTQRGMFDLALSSAASLRVDMSDLFRALATRCVELHRASDLPSDSSLATWLHKSPITSRLRGPPSALASRYLQISLSRHDSPKTQFRYRDVVADTMFSMNQDAHGGWQMPHWLVEWEMTRNPEGWISKALRWGWANDAVNWTLELLRNTTPPELLPPRKPDVADIPYNLIDRVIAAASEGDESKDASIQSKVTTLREETKRRIAGLQALK